MKKKRFKLFGGIVLTTLLGLVTVVSCESTDGDGDVSQSTTLMLNCSSTSIFVGETTTVSIANSVSGKSYIFISSNEDVASITDEGVVTGVTEGTTTITVYQSDNFNVTGSLTISVFNKVSSGNIASEITLDTTNAKLEFAITEEFSTEGLVVYVDGVEVTDYSTNPAVGTLLYTVGENTVYVSYQGAESVSYTINVVPLSEDTSLVDFVTTLSSATTYTYSIYIDGSVQLEDDSVVSGLRYTYQFGDTAYFLETIAGNQPYYDYTYGYVNTDDGVMKYTVQDEIVYPISYASHTYRNYTNLSLTTYNELVTSNMPTRKVGDYFSITDNTTISYLTSSSRTNVSSVSTYLRDIKAYLEDDVLSFVLDCGTYGTITLTYSDVGNTTPSYIDDYISRYGTDVETYDEVNRAKELFAKNNYTYSLGSSVGTAYVTENYVYYDYLDSYIESYYTENSVELKDNGYAVYDGVVYSFEAENNQIVSSSIAEYKTLGTEETFMDVVDEFPSTLSMFNDNLDMFEPTTITTSGYTYDTYEIQYDDVPDEVSEFYGYTASAYYIPYSTGIIVYDSTLDSSASIIIYVGYTSLSFSSDYFGYTYSNFGNTSVDFIEEYLTNLS